MAQEQFKKSVAAAAVAAGGAGPGSTVGAGGSRFGANGSHIGANGSRIGANALASVVVFLVVLPLCMGISIASGMPPTVGMITGIVGGLAVGFISGSPLQVSGPAAGLTVLVYDLVQAHGQAKAGRRCLRPG